MDQEALVPSRSLAILFDLGRPDLDSWRFQAGDPGHLCDRDTAFDEYGDSLLEYAHGLLVPPENLIQDDARVGVWQ
jgi:hypothetical protein